MNYKMIDFPAKKVVGMEYAGQNENQEIVGLWDAFMKRYQEVKGIHTQIMYGLCYDYEEGGAFSYLAAVEVDEMESMPEGMKLMSIPARTYAVFTFSDHLSKIGEFWDKIYAEYLPANNLKPEFGMSFELYDERFGKSGEFDIYVPIQK